MDEEQGREEEKGEQEVGMHLTGDPGIQQPTAVQRVLSPSKDCSELCEQPLAEYSNTVFRHLAYTWSPVVQPWTMQKTSKVEKMATPLSFFFFASK